MTNSDKPNSNKPKPSDILLPVGRLLEEFSTYGVFDYQWPGVHCYYGLLENV